MHTDPLIPTLRGGRLGSCRIGPAGAPTAPDEVFWRVLFAIGSCAALTAAARAKPCKRRLGFLKDAPRGLNELLTRDGGTRAAVGPFEQGCASRYSKSRSRRRRVDWRMFKLSAARLKLLCCEAVTTHLKA